MKRKWLLGMCLLLLTGCGAAARSPRTYWTEEYGGCQVSLRDSGTAGALDVVLCPGGREERVLRTLADVRAEDIFTEPFTDVMGWDGFRLTAARGWRWRIRRRTGACAPTMPWRTAPPGRSPGASGWGSPQDWSVDLDGAGEAELVSNVTYGGDGRRSVYVYQRRGDEVWLGRHSQEGLPDIDDRGAVSLDTVYDPERQVFQLRYAVKGREGYALLETSGLERLEFAPYAPEG